MPPQPERESPLRHLMIAMSLALAGCGSGGPASTEVSAAWVRLAAVPGRPAAAYFTVDGGAEPARLIAIESPKVATIELHDMAMQGNVMTMARLDGADVAAGGKLAFAPGGKHAMLFGVDPAIKPGDTLPLSFRFAKGTPIAVDAKVVAAGSAAY